MFLSSIFYLREKNNALREYLPFMMMFEPNKSKEDHKEFNGIVGEIVVRYVQYRFILALEIATANKKSKNANRKEENQL